MIKKKGFKLILISMLAILLTSAILPVYSLAIDKQYTNGDQFDSYTNFTDRNVPGTNGSIGNMLTNFLGVFLTLARIVALGWAIVMLISIAIKYMSASAQVRAQIKTDLTTYLIGAFILFGAFGFLTFLQWFVTDVL